ncbi:MAG TPA: M23 family metallopeptidase [Paludibacteraceae bacterium]|nr:M23 family metallopeptidase [Paludibacteraceae bacterium]HPH62191.1 M23 family metallopeptidase [Paludibacteraceae bacterium]
MRHNNKNIVAILLLSLFAFSANAQQKTTKEKVLASVAGMQEQRQTIDSLLLIEATQDEEYEDIPSDSLYGEWDNETLNPYKVKITEIKDSFLVDCSEYVHPIDNIVTSEYGQRWGRFHAGIDMRIKVGDSVRSAFSGKVRIARTGSRRRGYGYYVVIRHENGLETLYGHLSKILVQPDQDVKAGEIIALGGNTGRSTGPHLHFETRYLGNPINPRNFIDFDNYVIKYDNYTITKAESFKEFKEFVNSPTRYYRVRQGDNLGYIAKKHRTTVSRLCKLNKLKATSVIKAGKKLRVS